MVVAELDDKEDHDEQVDGDYVVDEKKKTATLTAAGVKKAEAYFNVENLADAENMTLQHHINQAIKARGVMKREDVYKRQICNIPGPPFCARPALLAHTAMPRPKPAPGHGGRFAH